MLDYETEDKIPGIEILFQEYAGLNITSPYKGHFVKDVVLSSSAQKIQAINCIKKKNGKFFGENTDFLAVVDIMNRFVNNFGMDLEIVILGDGVMSRVCQLAAGTCALNAEVFSRKTTNDFDQLKLDNYNPDKQLLIINSCSRDYVFTGTVNPGAIFWDLNYNFETHKSLLGDKVKKYIDGSELLELQARYALAFWSDN